MVCSDVGPSPGHDHEDFSDHIVSPLEVNREIYQNMLQTLHLYIFVRTIKGG